MASMVRLIWAVHNIDVPYVQASNLMVSTDKYGGGLGGGYNAPTILGGGGAIMGRSLRGSALSYGS